MIKDLELRTWQRARRYAVPATMIERCTQRRLAGDWRGACAAGRIDVAFTDTEAEPFEQELSELAPDLLRWYLPRALGGRTTLATNQVYVLSLAERIEPDEPVLAVRLPKTVDGSQRLTLEIVENGKQHFDLPPRLWSAERLAPLRGSGSWPGRLDETSLVKRWRQAGIEFDPSVPPEKEFSLGDYMKLRRLAELPLNVTGLADEVRRLAHRYRTDRVGLFLEWNLLVGFEVDGQGRVAAAISTDHEDILKQRHRIGEAVFRRPVDPDLFRHGLIAPSQLHPLVRQALALPDEGPEPPSTWDGLTRVRCQGQWHRIEHRAGELVVTSHSDEEIRREQAMRGLGGKATGCFAAWQAWTGKSGRLPKALRLHRRDAFQQIVHGGSEAMLRLLDEGLDPHMRDGRGATLLHHLRCVDHTKVLPRLLRAGVELEARDRRGRTPLHVAVGDGGTPELVRALLEAGADPHASDAQNNTVLKLAEFKKNFGREEKGGGAVQRNLEIVTGWAKR